MPRKSAKKTAEARAKAETIAACIRGTLADMELMQRAAKKEAEAEGRTLNLRSGTPEDVKELIPLAAWPVLFSMAQRSTREAVRDRIEGRITADDMTEGQRLYFSLAENYIIAKTPVFSTTEGGDYPTFAEACKPAAAIVAGIFGIEEGAMRRYCADLQKKIFEDNAQYLPAMQPTAEESARAAENAGAAASLEILYMLKPEPQKKYLTPHSKFDLFASYLQNTGEKQSNLKIWDGNNALVQWNITGGRITPFDQEVEAAVSNLVIRERARRNGHSARESVKDGQAVGFTVEQIYCEMNGITELGNYKINPSTEKKIRESVAKLDNSTIDVVAKNKTGQAVRVKGRILHVDEVIVKHPGKKPVLGYAVLSVGKLTAAELDFNDLLTVTPEQRNIGTSGIAVTDISIIIRKWLIREIFRIRNAAYLGDNSRTIYFDKMYDYEASESIVEYGEDGNPLVEIVDNGHGKKSPVHILKTGRTPAEQTQIRKAKQRRRDIALAIMEHLRRNGLVKGYNLNPDKTGIVVSVDKTDRAARRIVETDKRQKRAARLTAKKKA